MRWKITPAPRGPDLVLWNRVWGVRVFLLAWRIKITGIYRYRIFHPCGPQRQRPVRNVRGVDRTHCWIVLELKLLHTSKRNRHLLKACLRKLLIQRTQAILVTTTMVCVDGPCRLHYASSMPNGAGRHVRKHSAAKIADRSMLCGDVVCCPLEGCALVMPTSLPTCVIHRRATWCSPWVVLGPILLRAAWSSCVERAVL